MIPSQNSTNKSKKPSKRISFIRIKKCAEHAEILYKMLKRKKRTHSISHKSMPTLQQHKDFVYKHPYRAWYLIKIDSVYAGSIYVLRNNCVGVSAVMDDKLCIPAAIRYILKKYKPLPAIKSVRAAEFDFNVAPSNKNLISILKTIGAKLTQVTYVFDGIKNID